MLPLYQKTITPFPNGKVASNANRGLLWNKFVNDWLSLDDDGEFKGLEGEDKKKWIKKFTTQMTLPPDILNRQRALVKALNGEEREFVSVAPFVTGMGLEHPVENGFLWHHTHGVPYIPASSVKGLARAWADYWESVDERTIHRLFGPPTDAEDHGRVGGLIFFDAFPVGNIELITEIMTPHDGGWRQDQNENKDENKDEEKAPSDWHSPVPIPYLAIAPGARFRFAIAPRPGSGVNAQDMAVAYEWLERALHWIGAGAKTAIGFGRFEKAGFQWQQGDEAIFDVAGGIPVIIEELDDQGRPSKVRNKNNGNIIKVADHSFIKRAS